MSISASSSSATSSSSSTTSSSRLGNGRSADSFSSSAPVTMPSKKKADGEAGKATTAPVRSSPRLHLPRAPTSSGVLPPEAGTEDPEVPAASGVARSGSRRPSHDEIPVPSGGATRDAAQGENACAKATAGGATSTGAGGAQSGCGGSRASINTTPSAQARRDALLAMEELMKFPPNYKDAPCAFTPGPRAFTSSFPRPR